MNYLHAAWKWIMTGLLIIIHLSLLGAIEQRDQRIQQLEAAQATCVPTRQGEIAVAAMKIDGTIECVITSGKSGNRVSQRMEYRT